MTEKNITPRVNLKLFFPFGSHFVYVGLKDKCNSTIKPITDEENILSSSDEVCICSLLTFIRRAS